MAEREQEGHRSGHISNTNTTPVRQVGRSFCFAVKRDGDSTQVRTSKRAYTANHDPDWVKSANSGSKPMRNQSRSVSSAMSSVAAVFHTPFVAHAYMLCSSFKPIEKEGTLRSIQSNASKQNKIADFMII